MQLPVPTNAHEDTRTLCHSTSEYVILVFALRQQMKFFRTLAQRHFAKLQLQKGCDSTQLWKSIMKPMYVMHGQTETPLHFRLITELEITKNNGWNSTWLVGLEQDVNSNQ